MKLRSLFVALAVSVAVFTAVAPTNAHAQGALYFNPVAIRVSTVADNGNYSFLGPNTTSRMFWGFTLGGYYTIPAQKKYPVNFGVDIRDTLVHANNAEINTFALGVRIAGTTTGKFHPYLEPFVADGSSRAPSTTLHITKGNYGVLGGGDLDLTKHITFRVAEVGYSRLTTASDGTIGGSATVPSATLIHISTGFVFRIP